MNRICIFVVAIGAYFSLSESHAQSVFDEPSRSVFDVQQQGGSGNAWHGNAWPIAPGYNGSVMHDSYGRQLQCYSMPGGQVRCFGE